MNFARGHNTYKITSEREFDKEDLLKEGGNHEKANLVFDWDLCYSGVVLFGIYALWS